MPKYRFFHALVTTTAIALPFLTQVPEASAHHGWSEYNNQQTLNLTGEIQSIRYGNPHTSIQLKSGNKVWTAVLAPSARMERRGLSNGALKAGQTVRVVGYPHRSETNEMRAERIVIGDRTVELR
ncbi:MAG: DUF6152 family protein [Leptolyngbyaceae cyanobacterium bins.302]|nr:DUF6152 family protein [Leptolyngbyaceae cyanobacterium bins.302]